MQQDRKMREKRVNTALGIAMVEGRKPSAKATDLARQYIDGKLSAQQIKDRYINSIKAQ